MPIGRLTKKTQRQEKSVTRNPPSTGPMAGASVVPTVRMLAARTRSAGGKTRKSMAIPTGAIMPPPAPCMTRKSDQLGHVLGQPAEGRADGEDDDGREQHPLAAEAVAQPARRRE